MSEKDRVCYGKMHYLTTLILPEVVLKQLWDEYRSNVNFSSRVVEKSFHLSVSDVFSPLAKDLMSFKMFISKGDEIAYNYPSFCALVYDFLLGKGVVV